MRAGVTTPRGFHVAAQSRSEDVGRWRVVEKVAQVSEIRHFYSPIVLRRSISFRPGKCVHCYAFGALWSTTILVTIRIESRVQLTTIAEAIVLAYFTCRQCWIRFTWGDSRVESRSGRDYKRGRIRVLYPIRQVSCGLQWCLCCRLRRPFNSLGHITRRVFGNVYFGYITSIVDTVVSKMISTVPFEQGELVRHNWLQVVVKLET